MPVDRASRYALFAHAVACHNSAFHVTGGPDGHELGDHPDFIDLHEKYILLASVKYAAKALIRQFGKDSLNISVGQVFLAGFQNIAHSGVDGENLPVRGNTNDSVKRVVKQSIDLRGMVLLGFHRPVKDDRVFHGIAQGVFGRSEKYRRNSVFFSHFYDQFSAYHDIWSFIQRHAGCIFDSFTHRDKVSSQLYVVDLVEI